MHDALLDQLEQLYQQLSAQLPHPASNSCDECRRCCSAEGVSVQRVTDLEIALLERHYGEQSATNFARYSRREKVPSGDYLFTDCPNLTPEGCGVYEHRPYSCRVFGLYRAVDTRLPMACVYIGAERVFAASDYYQSVPGAVALRALSRDFQLRKPPGSSEQGGPSTTTDDPGLAGGDSFDQALSLIGEGKAAQAATLLPDSTPDDSPFADYVRATIAGELGQHAQALHHYLRVLSEWPDRYDLMTFAGLHAFQLGRPEFAEQLWLRSIELGPQVALTYSFLGYLARSRAAWQDAVDYFGAAAELEPEQPLHRQRLEESLQALSSAKVE